MTDESATGAGYLPLTVLLLASDADVTDLVVLSDADARVDWYGRSPDSSALMPQPGPEDEPRLQVAVRRIPRSETIWRPFLRSLRVDLSEDAAGDTESVILAVPSTTASTTVRWVLFCFGGSSRSVPVDLVDSRFGVVVALNKQAAGQSIPPWRDLPADVPHRRVLGDPAASVRHVTAEVRDGHRHRMVAHAHGPAPVQGLRFDTVSDLLHGLGVRTEDGLMRDLTGSRSLRFSTFMESLDDFEGLAEYLVEVRQRTDYKADWEWIDDIVPAQTKGEADAVLEELAERLGTDGEPKVDMLVPTWATQNDESSGRLLVAFPGEHGQPSRALLSWTQLRDWLLVKRSASSQTAGLLRAELRAYMEGVSSASVERVRISDLLVAELEMDGEQYILSEGDVYRVATGFLERLDDRLAQIGWSDFPYPTYMGSNEVDYLNTAVGRCEGRLALLDRMNITLPGQTPFEPCDLITDDGTLTFAKLKGRSSTFSHLCTQVVAAAEMLLQESAARDALMQRVTESTSNPAIIGAVERRLAKLADRQPNSLKLCLLLLGPWKDRPDTRALPLVSRLILRKTVQRLTAYGFTIELASPPPEIPGNGNHVATGGKATTAAGHGRTERRTATVGHTPGSDSIASGQSQADAEGVEVTGDLSDPVLNGPYDPPERYFEIGPDGPTGVVKPGRRPSESWVPIPATRKGRASGQGVQESLDFDATGERREINTLINDIRREVERWRASYLGVTPITRKLLQHWSDPARGEDRVLFCQREAVETAIFLAEVAGRGSHSGADWRRRLDEHNAIHNARLPRTALKMATGSGKTVVMAMLIAWQTLNHAHSPRDARFTNRFLVVAPGITIRDRLRVLLPSDDENYYKLRDLVPADLWGSLRSAHVVITNYHAFLPRDRREIKGVSGTTRKILTQGRADDPFRETDADVVSRVLRGFGAGAGTGKSGARVLVLNDEAHHCYQDKPLVAADGGTQAAADAEAAERNAEARVWFKGLQAINRKVGLKGIYDLSATPYYLSGSGYNEGYIFPWTVSDFSLMDAIESGIVKVPRLPVDDDAAGQDVAYLNLWDSVGKDLPKRRTKQAVEGAGWTMPAPLQGALESLYRSYERSWRHYLDHLKAEGHPPPVFIVVCPNTVVSKLVYDWIAGHEVEVPGGDGSTALRKGGLELFSNVEDGRWLRRPRTLLIDSVQLESGEALRPDFKQAAAVEIETFKAEYRHRYPGVDVEKLTDEDLLREVMNTVGRPGRLGGDLRCVVSVSMLTEGWDANTVTHILGVRAFGSQLLCEQVVGRGLRRRSYALNEDGRFDAEYANVYGVPFSFISGTPAKEGPPRPAATDVVSVPGREGWRIEFPRVEGYRLEIPDDDLVFDLDGAERLKVDREHVATWTRAAGVAGAEEDSDLSKFGGMRPQQVAYAIARLVVDTHLLTGDDRRPWLFPRVVELTRQWLSSHVDLEEGLAIGFVGLAEYRAQAAEIVARAISTVEGSSRERLRPILSRFEPRGSTAAVRFSTRKPALRADDKCELSHVVLDGPGGNTWEQILKTECELHPDVAAYVKNDHVGLAIPYVHKGVTHSYVPDFLLRLRRRDPSDVERMLVVEVSGGRKSPGPTAVKARTAHDLWCASVNNHGGFGRWGYVEITHMLTARERLNEAIAALYADAPIVGDPELLDITV